jgi:general stress protein CsbA
MTEIGHSVTVITQQSGTVSGYPHETVAVFIDIVHMITGHTITDVKLDRIILLNIATSCRYYQIGKQK